MQDVCHAGFDTGRRVRRGDIYPLWAAQRIVPGDRRVPQRFDASARNSCARPLVAVSVAGLCAFAAY